MKKWTVMLIPHNRGNTRTLTVSSLHFWGVVGLLTVLTFSTTFFYARHQAIMHNVTRLREANRALELANANKPQVVDSKAISEKDAREIEDRLRAQYEASISTITAELNELLEIEAKARDITGLAPRGAKPKEPPAATDRGGKGGPAGGGDSFSHRIVREMLRPPNVIYGMSRPSADLLMQEIKLRKQSLRELVREMEEQTDRIERMPSIWPLVRGAGSLISPFGYRRDPFTRRIRHHDGTDISAPYATKVRSTAKGVVLFAGYESDYGNVVRVDHGNGLVTCYAHLSKIFIKEGATVARGDIVGALGNTGRSTGPHLHYEVRVKGKPVNPEKYLTD